MDTEIIYALGAIDGGIVAIVKMFKTTAIVRISNLHGPKFVDSIHFQTTPRGTAADKAIKFVQDAIVY